jgi:SAM-dependent methyltransferase
MTRLAMGVAVLACVCLPAALGRAAGEPTPAPRDTDDLGRATRELRFSSKHLGGEVVVLPGVFHPIEAEVRMLGYMKENADRFAGKRVLEIGTGSGIVSVYAAKLGAKKVVATDIDPQAIKTAQLNAEKFGVGSIVEARLVPLSDMSAYSVIKDGETFDTIISNPPYTLDLDAKNNDPLFDTGDLGFSIIRGLDKRLAPGGKAILLYATMFYHLAMVKFAEHSGFEVRYHQPSGLTGYESQILFNSYLARLLAREKVDPTAFRFTNQPGPLNANPKKAVNSLGASAPTGMMVIERKLPVEGAAPSAPGWGG